LLIPDPDPTIAPSRIPDPGGKKAPDPDPQHWSAKSCRRKYILNPLYFLKKIIQWKTIIFSGGHFDGQAGVWQQAPAHHSIG
jgi:hypothetical protein